ncbi:RrF2 family transcriptional regulator [Synechococcus elongatus]|uniref:Rrf2 family transcriptional regulator n=1 Tax=Synechococcus elongatus PCC 11801 TaxID=2219813 RepID=A0AAN1QNQ5_SYNEL|nr:Rrf2 family transcriptional regulator [Synechococcus elongatus]AZB72707.1 Rrf2 family transcriptional regulator [Synechococcus elongatus PCC 11801]
MAISSTFRYALIALVEVAKIRESGGVLQIEEIATQQQLPTKYLGQILTLLRKQGFLISQRGRNGGYRLARDHWQIRLIDIYHSLEEAPQAIAQASDQATSSAKVVDQLLVEVESAWRQQLEQYTLQDLREQAEGLSDRGRMFYI